MNVLVVDDHAVLRLGLVTLLKTDERIESVVEAEDGEEAVRKARELKPDVVVMDLMMPGMDGVTATREIVSQAPGVRVLILTSYGADEISRALAAGVTELQDWFGTVHKTGSGTLAVGMDKGSKVNASNRLYVDEGTVEIRKADTSAVVVYTVGIASNAVLRLPTTSSVQIASLKPENGAILETPVISDGANGYTIKSISQYGGGTTQKADTETLVSLCGSDVDKLQPGSYPILMSCPLTSQDRDIKWKFVKRHGRRGRGTFHFGPHPTSDKCKALYLDYEIPGMILLFR